MGLTRACRRCTALQGIPVQCGSSLLGWTAQQVADLPADQYQSCCAHLCVWYYISAALSSCCFMHNMAAVLTAGMHMAMQRCTHRGNKVQLLCSVLGER